MESYKLARAAYKAAAALPGVDDLPFALVQRLSADEWALTLAADAYLSTLVQRLRREAFAARLASGLGGKPTASTLRWMDGLTDGPDSPLGYDGSMDDSTTFGGWERV
jgi:hypothetical protein